MTTQAAPGGRIGDSLTGSAAGGGGLYQMRSTISKSTPFTLARYPVCTA